MAVKIGIAQAQEIIRQVLEWEARTGLSFTTLRVGPLELVDDREAQKDPNQLSFDLNQSGDGKYVDGR